MVSHETSVRKLHRYAGLHCSTIINGNNESCSMNLNVMNALRICSWAHWSRSSKPMRPTLPQIFHLMWRIDRKLSRVAFEMKDVHNPIDEEIQYIA